MHHPSEPVVPVKIVVEPAQRDDAAAIGNLMQLYAYDFSEIVDLDVDERGLFAGKPLDAYWNDEGRHPFLIRVDAKLAGFALVHQQSRLTGALGIFDMAEFFVLKKYRRRGVGAIAASAVFDRFRGDWEVRERSPNVAATTFWRRVIGAYTKGDFKEVAWDDSVWVGPVQFFSSRR